MRYAKTPLGRKVALWAFLAGTVATFVVMPITAAYLMRDASIDVVKEYRKRPSATTMENMYNSFYFAVRVGGIPLAINSFLGIAISLVAAFKARRPADGVQFAVDDLVHDLRGPIAGIKSSAEFALDGAVDPLDALKSISDRSDTLLAVYDENAEIVCNFAGIAKESPREMDLARTVEGIADLFRDQAEAKGVRFRILLPDRPLTVKSYRQKMRCLVSNLTDNAVKYTDGGEITISLCRGLGRATLVVKDTGAGMTGEEVDQMQTAFYRCARSTDRPGIGSGMPLVYSVVALCRGSIRCKSSPGKGTCFTVKLPLDMTNACGWFGARLWRRIRNRT